MRKPNKCTYIKKFDWSEAFLCIQNVKTYITKTFFNYIKILFWKWKFSFS